MVLIDKIISKILSVYEGFMLKDCDFAVVSNNCWGYKIYHSVGKEYNTPFVGLFLYPECYLKVCSNLEKYLMHTLSNVSNKSKYFDGECNYFIGHIDDIEIHFLHYRDENECIRKWNVRSKRLLKHIKNNNKVLFQFNDRDLATKDQIKQFHCVLDNEIKVSFGVQDLGIPNHFKVKKIDMDINRVVDGVRLYDSRYRYISLNRILNDI
ncbi:capsular polysaccharide biosynthesis protein [Photobacterium damselae]|uniref:Capsular polysaccharide biosynthesis protein n=1 Tax=Photobacterium damselae TaxID=38293 RepID=A0ACD3SV56_PHODM|nr:DUF1919 domain-containing protein [Photobacterium damselae]RDL31286.1 hypothetical protein BC461_09230 [Photobacterium damselae]TMX50477.1 capsular polysaccharide biosynthesis protein [Photobacterium damselae]TMX63730.1 capsular polysaccharide biosynthesis protein [Photobacterium damselae]TMX70286.1 capsular polysaccharide biosynthesis protein [Photobacterium damselae]